MKYKKYENKFFNIDSMKQSDLNKISRHLDNYYQAIQGEQYKMHDCAFCGVVLECEECPINGENGEHGGVSGACVDQDTYIHSQDREFAPKKFMQARLTELEQRLKHNGFDIEEII